MEILIQNASGKRLPSAIQKDCTKLIRSFIRSSQYPDIEHDITVRFITSLDMKRMNREFKKHNYVTDILTFSSGDIVICRDAAAANATSQNHSTNRELLHLVCHGMLHLLGYDDKTGKQRKLMDEISENTLDSLFDW
ncbi:MAG: rRNA maturation RNase YbeY [Candidatus Lindowbacteria bacterium]|nr:rRNA maturation RNase YbeY [Candidatus Lindowbacteria bacterium]